MIAGFQIPEVARTPDPIAWGYTTDKAWVLVARLTSASMKAHADFKWPDLGPVECPVVCIQSCSSVCKCIFRRTGDCGNGLHAWEFGIGDLTATGVYKEAGFKWQIALVEDHVDNLERIDGKVKFNKGFVLFTGDQAGYAAAFRDLGAELPKQIGRAVVAGTEGAAATGSLGSATAGYRGSATAGKKGIITIAWWDGDSSEFYLESGRIERDDDAKGQKLQPDRPYRLNDSHLFERVPGVDRIQIEKGNIVEHAAHVIVNAANESLLGGGGVDGAIHEAAGPKLLEACKKLGGALPGEAKITPAFNLRARFIAHAVGPRWQGGEQGEDAVLDKVYRAAIAVGIGQGAVTFVFPSISTGAFGFPLERAAPIALKAVIEAIEETRIAFVRFVCFDDKTLRIYTDALATLKK